LARKYVLDTNVYIDAIADPRAEAALDRFLARHAPFTVMSAVVMQELRAGALTDRQAAALQDGLFAPFERRGRVVAPSAAAFKDCGRVLAEMRRADGVPFGKRPRGLVNDILIAASCRETGLTLITRDGGFATIGRYVRGFTWQAPWVG
jgi:predicted nucleic acid-binding protein